MVQIKSGEPKKEIREKSALIYRAAEAPHQPTELGLQFRLWLDAFGVFLSALCLIHCLLLPLAVLSLPILMRYYLLSPWVHFVLLATISIVAGLALGLGFFKHKKWQVLCLGGFGFSLVAAGSFMGTPEQLIGESKIWFLLILVVGGILLAISHILNSHYLQSHLFCRSCKN